MKMSIFIGFFSKLESALITAFFSYPFPFFFCKHFHPVITSRYLIATSQCFHLIETWCILEIGSFPFLPPASLFLLFFFCLWLQKCIWVSFPQMYEMSGMVGNYLKWHFEIILYLNRWILFFRNGSKTISRKKSLVGREVVVCTPCCSSLW